MPKIDKLTLLARLRAGRIQKGDSHMVRDYDKPDPGAVLAALPRIIANDPSLRREASIYALLHKRFPITVSIESMLDGLGATSPDVQSRAVEFIERAFLEMNNTRTEGCCGKE